MSWERPKHFSNRFFPRSQIVSSARDFLLRMYESNRRIAVCYILKSHKMSLRASHRGKSSEMNPPSDVRVVQYGRQVSELGRWTLSLWLQIGSEPKCWFRTGILRYWKLLASVITKRTKSGWVMVALAPIDRKNCAS